MSQDVRYALVRDPLSPHSKPVAKATLADLARAIHFDRKGAAIILGDAPFKVRGFADELAGVAITTLSEGGDPHRYIGLAWLDGGDRHALQRALDSQVSVAPTIGRAA